MGDPIVAVPLPSPGDKDTLKFKGKRTDASLVKFEYYAERAKLTKCEKCRNIRFYFSKEKKSWISSRDTRIVTGASSRSLSRFTHRPVFWRTPKKSKSESRHCCISEPESESSIGDHSSSHKPQVCVKSSLCLVGATCAKSYHEVQTQFLMFLGICHMDGDRVHLRNGSTLPHAGGEGGIGRVI